jgi:hypothetical protein
MGIVILETWHLVLVLNYSALGSQDTLRDT